MLVSTKGRYALRTMVDLAVHGDGEPVKIKDIANRQGISGKYLEQIISIPVSYTHLGSCDRREVVVIRLLDDVKHGRGKDHGRRGVVNQDDDVSFQDRCGRRVRAL